MPPAPPPAAPKPEPLRALGNYEPPPMPADDAVRSWVGRAWELLRQREEAGPLIGEDKLRRAEEASPGGEAPAPVCEALLRDLDAELTGWLSGLGAAGTRVRVVVLPPGDRDCLLRAWAERRGLDVLPAPDRAALTDPDPPAPDLGAAGSGEGPLVVPRLERWFLRRHDGLAAVRGLLAAVERTDRRVLVGCNGWAWDFLCAAVRANLGLPAPRTFRAFGAKRLAGWFAELAADAGGARFRSPKTGRDIPADGTVDDFHRTLAARSRGIPWVAWDLWRRSLRTEAPDESDAAAATPPAPGERRTLWVAALEEFTLPTRHEPEALLALHALLIHGPLTREELAAVAPDAGGPPTASALLAAGFVRREKCGELAVVPAAYPAIRAGLAAAGFPTDSL